MSKKPTYEELLKRVKQLEKNFAESKRVAKDLEQEKKFSKKGELRTLNFFTEDKAFQAAEYLMAATPRTWKKILRKKRDFVTDFILGKIGLELGTQVSMLELALYANNMLDCLTQVDLQFPDEMSADELATYRLKMETFRHAKGT